MHVYVFQFLVWLPWCTQVMRGRHHGMCPSRRSDASRAFRFIALRRRGAIAALGLYLGLW